jgi:DNA polymerase
MMHILEKQEALDVLNYQIRSCERCTLSKSRKHALIGEGSPDAKVLIVALSPGIKEDSQNRMFIGPSGQVLNQLFFESGMDRKKVFMSNLIKCMLPHNRKPQRTEIECCSVFLEDELSIVQPEIVVPLGSYAVRFIMQKYDSGHQDSLSEPAKFIFGKIITLSGQKIFPLSHPASLLYNPSRREQTLKHYKALSHFVEFGTTADGFVE